MQIFYKKSSLGLIRLILTYWKDYELIDSGNGKKFERFGEIKLIRPELIASWRPEKTDWQADAEFDAETKVWRFNKEISKTWQIFYKYKDLEFKIFLEISDGTKQIGVFPEQMRNWGFIFDEIRKEKFKNPQVLNLFGYSGVSSIVSKFSGGKVTHVDSSSHAISLAQKNAEINGISDIRWMKDDSEKFLEKEFRRKKFYDFVILDPPSFGKGTSSSYFKINKNFEALVYAVSKILKHKGIVILSLHSKNFNEQIVKKVLAKFFQTNNIHFGDLEIGKINFGRYFWIKTV
ncbi:MAG: class I SAM-dependent methyltransferase [Patescibacteria group bacterium]